MNKPILSKFSAEYMAVQVAGSCRMEGIRVSSNDEKRLSDIIDGRVDAKALASQIAQQYRARNKQL